MNIEKFSDRVKELRIERSMSQKELGEIIGVSYGAVSDIERNRRSTLLSNAVVLADYFDVSIDYLVGRTDNPNSHKL